MEGVTSTITFLMTTLGTVVTTVTENPILLIPIGLTVVGGAIAIFKRLA